MRWRRRNLAGVVGAANEVVQDEVALDEVVQDAVRAQDADRSNLTLFYEYNIMLKKFTRKKYKFMGGRRSRPMRSSSRHKRKRSRGRRKRSRSNLGKGFFSVFSRRQQPSVSLETKMRNINSLASLHSQNDFLIPGIYFISKNENAPEERYAPELVDQFIEKMKQGMDDNTLGVHLCQKQITNNYLEKLIGDINSNTSTSDSRIYLVGNVMDSTTGVELTGFAIIEHFMKTAVRAEFIYIHLICNNNKIHSEVVDKPHRFGGKTILDDIINFPQFGGLGDIKFIHLSAIDTVVNLYLKKGFKFYSSTPLVTIDDKVRFLKETQDNGVSMEFIRVGYWETAKAPEGHKSRLKFWKSVVGSQQGRTQDHRANLILKIKTKIYALEKRKRYWDVESARQI